VKSPFHEPPKRHILVLLDPSHVSGESALHYARRIVEEGDQVTLAVWPKGSAARSLGQLSEEDGITEREVADRFLDDMAGRLAGIEEPEKVVLPTLGLSPALRAHIAWTDVTEVVMPATIAGSERGIEARVALESGVSVTVANGQLRRRIA
jgi:hypothetical protein